MGCLVFFLIILFMLISVTYVRTINAITDVNIILILIKYAFLKFKSFTRRFSNFSHSVIDFASRI